MNDVAAMTADPLHAEMTQKMVLDYLRQHPNFLIENPEILDTILPTERNHGRGVVDFQNYAIDHLRKNVGRFKERFQRLVTASQDNLSVQHQVQKAVVSIVATRNIEQLLEVLTTDLLTWFDVDVVRLALESDMAGLYDTYYSESNYSGICFVPNGTANAALLNDEVRLIADTQAEPPIGFEMIYADCSNMVRSCALLRLNMESIGRSAILAFGVRHTDHFHPHQGSDYLAFLAQVMSQVLDRALSESEMPI